MRASLAVVAALFAATAAVSPAAAGSFELKPVTITEWKAVYGRVEARTNVPARARLGGIVIALTVSEGDQVKAGQVIATVRDDKLAFQIAALDAQLRALESQRDTAQSELARTKALVDKGVLTPQRLEQQQMAVDVVLNQISATEASRAVVVQQQAEGNVLAPADGRVLTVPVTMGAVIMAGEPVATIGSGGMFLRLAIPERHAGKLKTGADIRITAEGRPLSGKLAKIYPEIVNGRVIADVDVDDLESGFVNARVLVEVPVGERAALLVPKAAITTRSGLDFVTVQLGEEQAERTVILGESVTGGVGDAIEVLTGLAAGDRVVTP